MKNFINSLHADQSITFMPNFGGMPVPSFHRPWEVGCIITIPKDYEICMQEMPSGARAIFIPVLVKFPDGEELADKFFISTLYKVVRYEGHFYRTTGTVIDALQHYSTLDDAFHYCIMEHPSFVISADIQVDSIRPDGTCRPTHVYRFDFA